MQVQSQAALDLAARPLGTHDLHGDIGAVGARRTIVRPLDGPTAAIEVSAVSVFVAGYLGRLPVIDLGGASGVGEVDHGWGLLSEG